MYLHCSFEITVPHLSYNHVRSIKVFAVIIHDGEKTTGLALMLEFTYIHVYIYLQECSSGRHEKYVYFNDHDPTVLNDGLGQIYKNKKRTTFQQRKIKLIYMYMYSTTFSYHTPPLISGGGGWGLRG